MITTNVLRQYHNGNCLVTIYEDGTKVREWDGTAKPEFPESIDLKITNVCDMGCAWCHESSIKRAKHGSMARILEVVKGLPAGVEIAIGGGNPLEFPDLTALLWKLRTAGLISNITVHGTHLFGMIAGDFGTLMDTYQRDQYIRGVGISHPRSYRLLAGNDMLPYHSVCHAIIGVDDPFDIIKLLGSGYKVLVLGYKTHGRGNFYYGDAVDRNMSRWKYFIRTMLGQPKDVLSFDNLALTQLDIKSLIPAEVWDERYMGDDGDFSMYFDAVTNQYGISSTSPLKDAGEMTIPEMFKEVK